MLPIETGLPLMRGSHRIPFSLPEAISFMRFDAEEVWE